MSDRKNQSRPFSLSSEIGCMFILLGLLPLFLIGWQYYKGVEKQLHDEISNSLSALADNKVERIESFAADKLREVQVLANSSIATQALVQLDQSPETELGQLSDELQHYKDNIEAADLFLISASGIVLFAAENKDMVGLELAKVQNDYRLLANAFDRARTLLEAHNSDFSKDAASLQPSGFVAAPILKNGYVIGVAALRLNKTVLNRILGDYSGLGRTGETMAGGRDGENVQLFGPVRFPEQFNDTLSEPFVEVFQSALSGNRDVGVLNDYRGQNVIAAWRYVPSFRWALVVKVDVEERLAAITQLRNMGVIFLSVMALLLITVSLFIARAITTPIRQLEMATRNLSETGEVTLVPERGAWEISSLAKGFNRMSERIHSYQTGLRRMVDERTAELSKAKDEAEKATLAKTEFLAMMSHEIRTPLNGLMGMAELLKSQEMGPLAHDYVQTLHQSGAALSDLLNDLLDISRIEAGKLDLHTQSFAPLTLMQSLSALMKRSAEMKGLSYELILSHDVPQAVLGDPARLRQVLLNITGNAIKFTAQGKIRVLLGVLEKSQDNVILLFQIEDTGIGIPFDEQHKLFQPFSQLGESRSKRYGGAGLGLAISKRLAERMGGDISVKSQPGDGSCFSLSLPFLISDIVSVDFIKDNKVVPLRVLIVEDEPINRRVLSGLLRQDGHDVLSSSSGEEAMDVLKSEPVDVVLTDLRLPGMSGIDIIEKVHKDWKIPVLAVTANLMPENVNQCLMAGALDVIGKPIAPDALRRALQRAIGPCVPEKPAPPVLTAQKTADIFSPAYLDQLCDVLADKDIRDLVEKADRSVKEHLKYLIEADREKNKENRANFAHKLAGVSGTYGMEKLRHVAKEIEKDHPFDAQELTQLAQHSLNAMHDWQKRSSCSSQSNV